MLKQSREEWGEMAIFQPQEREDAPRLSACQITAFYYHLNACLKILSLSEARLLWKAVVKG